MYVAVVVARGHWWLSGWRFPCVIAVVVIEVTSWFGSIGIVVIIGGLSGVVII